MAGGMPALAKRGMHSNVVDTTARRQIFKKEK
jgi:hypothetical protein